jgi:hypothetical protein
MLSSITCGSPLNIHHGGHHATILTILHSRVLFLTSLSPNRRRWRSSEKARRSRTQTLINSIYADYLPNKVPAGCSLDEEDAGLMPLLANRPTSAMAGRPPTSINVSNATHPGVPVVGHSGPRAGGRGGAGLMSRSLGRLGWIQDAEHQTLLTAWYISEAGWQLFPVYAVDDEGTCACSKGPTVPGTREGK